jgi:hypothetical protein
MSDIAGASPNYDEICNVMEERLVAPFSMVGDRMQAADEKIANLEKEIADLKDIVYKMVTGFGDAVNEHKKGSYSEMLASKYGPDLEEVGGPYSEIYGKDLKDELLEKLMGGELGEDGIPDFVGGIKAKFAKIRAPAADGSVGGTPPEEPPVEANIEEVKNEEPAPESEEEEEPPDMAGKMAKTLGLKMNSPKVPKFGKKA